MRVSAEVEGLCGEIVRQIAESVIRTSGKRMRAEVADLQSVGNLAFQIASTHRNSGDSSFQQFARLIVWRAMDNYTKAVVSRKEVSFDCIPPETLSTDKYRIDLASQDADLHWALNNLTWRERKVISLMYESGMTQHQVATVLGMSFQRVSQLHMSAVERMRNLLASRSPRGADRWIARIRR